jgi:hypothetical protein
VSYSQFHSKAKVKKVTGAAGADHWEMAVGGPVTLVPNTRYQTPFWVHFMVIQNPPGDFDPNNAIRASGMVKLTDATATEWAGSVRVKKSEWRNAEARGVGVLVLDQTDGYAVECVTWCEHITIEVE